MTKTQEAQALCELWQSDLVHKAEYEMALDAVAAWQAKEAKKAARAQAKKDAEAKKQAKKAQPVVTQETSTQDAPAQTADNASDTKSAPEPPKVPEYDPVQTALHQEQLLALLSQVKALAGTLPHDMSCLADSVTLIEQLMALIVQPTINGADLQQLTLRCLEFTHALTSHQLIVLGAAGDSRLADARTALEFLHTQLQAWQQLRVPAHIIRAAQFLTQSLTTEADLVAIPYYEPQGQPFAPWVYGIGKALGKSERLVQLFASSPLNLTDGCSEQVAACQKKALSLTDAIIDFSQKALDGAYSQALSTQSATCTTLSAPPMQLRTTLRLLEQLNQAQESSKHLRAQVRKGKNLVAQAVHLCTQLYGLLQELQCQLMGQDEPSALLSTLDASCYVVSLVEHALATSLVPAELILGLKQELTAALEPWKLMTKLPADMLNQDLAAALRACNKALEAMHQQAEAVDEDASPRNLEQFSKAYDKLCKQKQKLLNLAGSQQEADLRAQLSWLKAPVRQACAQTQALASVAQQLTHKPLAAQLIEAPLLIARVQQLTAFITVLAPAQLKTLVVPLKQALAFTTLDQAALSTLYSGLNVAVTQAQLLQQQLSAPPSFKPQAALVRNLDLLARFGELLSDNPAQAVKQGLAQAMLEALETLQRELARQDGATRTQLAVTLSAVHAQCALLAQGDLSQAPVKIIQELLHQGMSLACAQLKEHSEAQVAAHAHALKQLHRLLDAWFKERKGLEVKHLDPELTELYQRYPTLCSVTIWGSKLQELLNALELAQSFLSSADTGDATYQLHLQWTAQLYGMAHTLREVLKTQHKDLVKLCKKRQNKVKKTQKKISQVEAQQEKLRAAADKPANQKETQEKQCAETAQPAAQQETQEKQCAEAAQPAAQHEAQKKQRAAADKLAVQQETLKKQLAQLQAQLAQHEAKLTEAQQDCALIKQLFDFINHKESDQHQRFKKLYSLLVDLKIQAIEQIIAGQGPELTDILAYQCPLFTVLECQRVRDQVQDDAEKWLTGKTKDQSKARGKQRSALIAARDWIKQQAQWRAQAQWDKAKFTELKTKHLQEQGKMARLTPQADEDNQEQKTAQQKQSTPAQNRNKEGSNKKKGGKTKNGLTKGQAATKCQDGSELATKPEQEVKPTGDSTKNQHTQDEKSDSVFKAIAPARPAKVKLMPQSADRLDYCSFTQEYLKATNFRVFTSKTNDQGTHIVIEQVQDSEQDKGKKENKPKIDVQLKARAPYSDGLIHPVTLHLDCNQREHYDQWRALFEQAKNKNKSGIKSLNLVYQNLHACKERMVKRLVVASCLPGISPFVAKQAIKAFKALGIKNIQDEEKMAAWRERKVALDLSQKSVAVVTCIDQQYYCFYQDILNLDNKKTAKQWRKLQLKYEQDKRAFSNYLAQINPKFYAEQGRRLTQDEAWTKFGLTEVFYDKKARYLLNVLRDDSRKIEQLRKQARHKLVCMLLPLGGTVIVEKTNFSGLAKRRSVSDGGNDLEASQADVQADSDLAATTLQTHPQATRGADSKGTLVCGTNPDAGSKANIKESASGAAAADGRQEQPAVTTLKKAQAQSSARDSVPQPPTTNQSIDPIPARQAPKSRPGFGASIHRAAPAAFLKAYSYMLSKFGGVLINAPTNQLKATQRNPLLKVDDPKAFQKLKGGLTQRYKRVIVPHELHSGKKELAIYVQRDFMAAFTLLHAINNPDLNPDKQKGDELNDVDVDACRKELQLFLRGYSHAMLHLCDKGLCSDNVKNNLRPSKFDLGAHDWHWGIKARSQINSALQTK